MSLKKIVLEECQRVWELFTDIGSALSAQKLTVIASALSRMQGAAEMTPDDTQRPATQELWKQIDHEEQLRALARQTEIAARHKAHMEEDCELRMARCTGGPADGDSAVVHPDSEGGRTTCVISGGRYVLNDTQTEWQWMGETK